MSGVASPEARPISPLRRPAPLAAHARQHPTSTMVMKPPTKIGPTRSLWLVAALSAAVSTFDSVAWHFPHLHPSQSSTTRTFSFLKNQRFRVPSSEMGGCF